MNFQKKKIVFKKFNYLFNSIIISLILSLDLINCDLILRSPKDLQSQFISKKI